MVQIYSARISRMRFSSFLKHPPSSFRRLSFIAKPFLCIPLKCLMPICETVHHVVIFLKKDISHYFRHNFTHTSQCLEWVKRMPRGCGFPLAEAIFFNMYCTFLYHKNTITSMTPIVNPAFTFSPSAYIF